MLVLAPGMCSTGLSSCDVLLCLFAVTLLTVCWIGVAHTVKNGDWTHM
jgi:hypothetical protein